MNTPSYEDQWQKITSAYMRNEIDPLQNCACFIGNLLNNKGDWAYARGWNFGLITTLKLSLKIGESCINKECGGIYSVKDVVKMEENFISVWREGGRTEQSLFEAMSSTLDLLRAIHESKGEVIDTVPAFQKRQLQTT